MLLLLGEWKNTFKCESCGYSCFLKGTLNEHIISIHERNMNQNFISICEENKPFKCEFCGYSWEIINQNFVSFHEENKPLDEYCGYSWNE